MNGIETRSIKPVFISGGILNNRDPVGLLPTGTKLVKEEAISQGTPSVLYLKRTYWAPNVGQFIRQFPWKGQKPAQVPDPREASKRKLAEWWKAAETRRILPRSEPDKRVAPEEQAASGRTPGERRTGEPMQAFIGQVKEFFAGMSGKVTIGLAGLGVAFYLFRRIRKA